MARDPGSAWAPLPEAGAPDGYVKTQFIVHSTGDNGTAKATARYFGGSTPNESTFIVGQGPWDPTLQIMDSTDRADANMSASIRAISVEVVGDGVGGYNAWQRSEIIRIGRWARAEHPGILPRIIPTHTEPGYGWHVMFGAPGPWAGVAKSCPGKQRIAELKADIFPAIFAGTPLSEEDDMTPEQSKMLTDLYNRVMGRDVQRWLKGGPDLDSFVVLDQWEDEAWPARSADVADIIGLLRTVQGGDARVMTEISSAFHQELDRDAANQAALDAQLSTVGNGDPEVLAAALKDALGDQLAADVAARLTVSPKPV